MNSYYFKENLRIVRGTLQHEGLLKGLARLASAYTGSKTLSPRPPLPFHAIIEITTHCNLRCPTCAQVDYSKENIHLTIEKFVRVLDSIPSARKVALLGLGEPFLNRNLRDFIRECKKRKQYVSLVSNATLLTEENRSMILNEGLDLIHLSIDGATKETFERLRAGANYEKTIEKIAALTRESKERNSKLRMIMCFTATMENLHELKDYTGLAKRLGISEIVVNDIHYFNDNRIESEFGDKAIGNYRSELSRTFISATEQARKEGVRFYTNIENSLGVRTCVYPWAITFVSITGDVTPCCLNGWDPDPLNFGNIYETPFEKIWYSDKYVKFRAQMKANEKPELCEKCVGWGREIKRLA
jgi:radical SAM protein with 4Fe4S-binding SPASM domain